ncbi:MULTISPECIES: DinB family protein [Paenibacillus]|uniref:Damage-inducible protein DinB n=1 Tax=Paenibacillus campinasensis TaxID=66347 RepID=A0A268EZD1_9BACL|nr:MULTISPECIES: DinB family protein [Paenibacillus]MUG65227.1 damage-inducible protein DinB [Paenibacillus campinasensis]PAD78486.1 damage-inducible protein DinB [Paenibacillus campinasensis]PAK52435.1 damage-inducible protein DinB [Paenibacillus sp. 7541]
MYAAIEQFLNDWKQEAELTLEVLDKLTDASLNQAVSEAQPRTLGDIAWHITQSVSVFFSQIGLEQEIPSPEGSAAAIAEAYRRSSESAITELRNKWAGQDEKLQEPVKLFGFIETTNAGVLNTLVRHQIHHRGQLTILMRQAGLAAPGVYGPNEEETAAMSAAREQS